MKTSTIGRLDVSRLVACALFLSVPAFGSEPGVRVTAFDPVALEGVTTAAFTVIRSGATNGPLTAAYALGGTASNGVDYLALPGLVTIPAGRRAADVIVQPINDGRMGGDKTVVMTLTTGATYRVTMPSTAVIRILDNPFLNALPNVTLLSPTNGALLRVPPDILLAAAVTDTADPVREVDFFVDGRLLQSVRPAPYSWVWPNAPQGTHVLTAAVVDGSGATNLSKPVSIQVVRVQPVVRWLTPAPGARIILPAVVPLSVIVTNDFGQVASVSFYANGSLLGTVTNAPYSLLWSNPAPNSYALEARARDVTGRLGVAAEFVVVQTNHPPTVRILSPEDLTTFRVPFSADVTLSAAGSQSPLRRVELFANGVSLAVFTNTVPTRTYEFPWRNMGPGNYTLTATATDARGQTSTSSPVRLFYAWATLNPATQGNVLARTIFNGQKQTTIVVSGDSSVPRPFVVGGGSAVSLGRGYAEFMIPALPGGLLNATLLVPHFQELGSTTVEISSYPADLVVTTNDFSDLTSPLAAFPASSVRTGLTPQTFTVDITELVQQFAGGDLGFQFKLADDLSYSPTNRTEEAVLVSGIHILLAPRTNLPPIVRILSPTNNTSLIAPSRLAILAQASDPDGTIESVAFFAGSTHLGVVRAPSAPGLFQCPWINPPAGSYDLIAVATDNLSANSTSAPVHLTVIAAPTPIVPGIETLDNSAPAPAPRRALHSTVPGAAIPPVLDYLTTLPDNRVQLTISGPTGSRIAVEVSSDFVDWTLLSVITNTAGTVQYTDPFTATDSRRFYRTRLAD